MPKKKRSNELTKRIQSLVKEELKGKKRPYLISSAVGLLLVVFVLLSVIMFDHNILTYLSDNPQFRSANTFNVQIPFTNPVDFTYNLSRMRVDNNGARLATDKLIAEIELQSNISLPEDPQFLGFEASTNVPGGTAITFQLSTDFTNWYYHNGNDWVSADECPTCGNTVAEVNDLIGDLPVFSDVLRIKAFLSSEMAGLTPQLYSVKVNLNGTQDALTDQQLLWLSNIQSASGSQIVCPFTPNEETIVVNFPFDHIRSDKKKKDADLGPISTKLPAGNYEVALSSYDDHSKHGGQNQPEESWYAILEHNGDEVVVSNSISDLPNDQNTITEVVNNSLNVSETVNEVIAFHSAHKSDNPNSVYPICAAFTKEGGPEPTETSTPTFSPEECLCEGKIKHMTVTYSGTSGVDIEVITKKKGTVTGFTNVQNGQLLVVDASGLDKGQLGTKTYFDVTNGGGTTRHTVHTSCSQDIAGLTFGPFTVVGYTDGSDNVCGGEPTPTPTPVLTPSITVTPTPPEECLCEGKIKHMTVTYS
ncbi:MAG: hypothetical protein ACE5DX_05970, partial [Candidatus Dojkabacteria bacterium]